MKKSALMIIVSLDKKDKKFWKDIYRNEIFIGRSDIENMMREPNRTPSDFPCPLNLEDKARLAASHGRHPYDTKRY